MEDSDATDPDGFPVQEYTVHFLPPIYPDPQKNRKENTNLMRERNFSLWKDTYEEFYKKELTY